VNNKELNEEEIQNYILSDPNNEIMIFIKKKELFNTHYYIRVVLNNPIDPMFNFTEIIYHMLYLSHIISIVIYMIKYYLYRSDKPNKNMILLQMIMKKFILVRPDIMI
jgi:hypothetical protein